MTTLPGTEPTVVLMESGKLTGGPIGSIPVVVRRGMAVRACDDCRAGYIAAVVVDRAQQQITHLLIIRHCEQPEYHLLPITAITQVDEAEIRLTLLPQAVAALPRWVQPE